MSDRTAPDPNGQLPTPETPFDPAAFSAARRCSKIPFRTVPELSAALGVTQKRILCWIASGELPAVDVYPHRAQKWRWRVAWADVEMFLAGRLPLTPAAWRRAARAERARLALHPVRF